jgi:hypothetical protein
VPARTPVPPGVRRLADACLVLVALGIPLSTTAMEAGVLGLAGLTAVAAATGWQVVRRSPLDVPLGVLYGTFLLSTLASLHPLEAIGWRKAWFVLAYFTAFWWVRDRAHAVRLARLLVVAGGLAAAYGVLQHFTGADWYRTLLGRPTAVRPRDPGHARFAVVGFFGNYLTFAHTMLIPLGLAAAWALRVAAVAWLPATALVVAIVLSTARGAWLAMAALAIALAALAGGRRAALPLAALAALGLATLVAQPDLRRQAAGMFALGGENAGRIGIFRANLDVVHDHPVLGLGYGRYATAARPYYTAHPEADRRSHAHNNYLHLAAEAGLLGLAAYAAFLAFAVRRGCEAVGGAGDPAVWATAAGALAAVVAIAVGGLTQYNFGDAEPAIATWTALALLMRCREA